MPSDSRYERHAALDVRVAPGWELDTIAPAAALFGANGLGFSPGGLLHVAEWLGDRVSTWDPADGRVGTAVGIEDPIDGPDDVAFAADGTLFVPSFGTGKVQARRPDGRFVTLMDDAPAANGITVDREGRLFVTEFRPGGRTLEIDTEVAERFREVTTTDHPNAFERGPDGRLFVPDVYAGSVWAIDTRSGGKEQVLDGLGMISAVRFDRAGRLVVCQQFEGVLAIDLATGARERLADRAGTDMVDNFCFGADGAVYATISNTGQVERYAPGRPDAPEVLIPGGLIGPYGLSRCGEDLLVSDYLGTYRRTADGTTTLFARALDRGPSLDAVALGPDRAIALSRAGGVFHMTRGATETRTIIETTGSHEFSGIHRADGARSLGPDGDGVVVGHAGGTILRLAADGATTAALESGLASVDAVTGDGAGVVVVADETAGAVAVLRDGRVARIDGLDRPAGVALLGRDAVAVAERGRGTIRLHPLAGGAPTTVAEGLPLRLPTATFRDDGRRTPLVAWDDATLLVGCAGDGAIRRLRATR